MGHYIEHGGIFGLFEPDLACIECARLFLGCGTLPRFSRIYSCCAYWGTAWLGAFGYGGFPVVGLAQRSTSRQDYLMMRVVGACPLAGPTFRPSE